MGGSPLNSWCGHVEFLSKILFFGVFYTFVYNIILYYMYLNFKFESIPISINMQSLQTM